MPTPSASGLKSDTQGAIDHTFYGFAGVITHAGCRENTRKAFKSQMLTDNFIFLLWLQRSFFRNHRYQKNRLAPRVILLAIFHEFEGTQSRVSINRSNGLNSNKYRIPDRRERL